MVREGDGLMENRSCVLESLEEFLRVGEPAEGEDGLGGVEVGGQAGFCGEAQRGLGREPVEDFVLIFTDDGDGVSARPGGLEGLAQGSPGDNVLVAGTQRPIEHQDMEVFVEGGVLITIIEEDHPGVFEVREGCGLACGDDDPMVPGEHQGFIAHLCVVVDLGVHGQGGGVLSTIAPGDDDGAGILEGVGEPLDEGSLASAAKGGVAHTDHGDGGTDGGGGGGAHTGSETPEQACGPQGPPQPERRRWGVGGPEGGLVASFKGAGQGDDGRWTGRPAPVGI